MLGATGLAVVDASVALMWQLDDEEHVAQAIALKESQVRGDSALIAPKLLIYEFVNGLAVASRKGRIDLAQASNSIVDLEALGIEFLDVDPAEMLRVAFEYRIAAYDAAYLALAESQNAELWTGDRSFYNASRWGARVRWIGDYGRA